MFNSFKWCLMIKIINSLTCVWIDETATTSTLKTPLWLSTHFMPGRGTYKILNIVIADAYIDYEFWKQTKIIISQWEKILWIYFMCCK